MLQNTISQSCSYLWSPQWILTPLPRAFIFVCVCVCVFVCVWRKRERTSDTWIRIHSSHHSKGETSLVQLCYMFYINLRFIKPRSVCVPIQLIIHHCGEWGGEEDKGGRVGERESEKARGRASAWERCRGRERKEERERREAVLRNLGCLRGIRPNSRWTE